MVDMRYTEEHKKKKEDRKDLYKRYATKSQKDKRTEWPVALWSPRSAIRVAGLRAYLRIPPFYLEGCPLMQRCRVQTY